jgi:predicted GIY-YIG superfamily endonuclease
MNFYYVYILQSVGYTEHFYVGFTEDLHARLATHNAGSVPATKLRRPSAVAFSEETQARAFECYLKSPSGRAFAKKRL